MASNTQQYKTEADSITPSIIQDKLRSVDVGENILHNYDNYNYHIKFYMPNHNIAHTYIKNRRSLNHNNEASKNQIGKLINDILHKDSIIISETGKTEDIIIDSLKIKTVSSTPHRGISTTTEITLELTEIGGASLVNKLTVASNLLGNTSYVTSYYCLDLWFSGYNNHNYSKKTIEEKIPFLKFNDGESVDSEQQYGDQYLTYIVMATKVDTKSVGDNTKYTFKLTGLNFNLNSPDLLPNNMMEKIDFEKGLNFKQSIKKFEKKLNEVLYDRLYDEAKEIYNKRNKQVLEINIDDKSSNEISTQNNEIIETTNDDSPIKDNVQPVKPSENNTNPAPDTTKSSENDGDVLSSNNVFNINPNDNITTAINKIWELCQPSSGCIPFIDVYPINVEDVSNNSDNQSGSKTTTKSDTSMGKPFPYYVVDVVIQEIPGLKAYKDGMKKNANPAWPEYITYIQREYLDGMVKEHSLKRRYYNKYNAKNIDLLDYKQNNDQMWFLNTSMGEENMIVENDKPNIKKTDEKPKDNEESNEQKDKYDVNGKTLNEIWEDYIGNKITTDIIKPTDDMFSKTMEDSAINFKNIFKPQEEVKKEGETKEKEVEAKKVAVKEKETVKQSIARIGAENFFSHGQKLTLEIDIIGDPYWLEYGSEFRGKCLSYHMPHVIMVFETPYKLNNEDLYEQDGKMKWASLYRVLTTTSTFSEGKFTQTITGVVATMFAFVNNKPIKHVKMSDETTNRATEQVSNNETNLGNKKKRTITVSAGTLPVDRIQHADKTSQVNGTNNVIYSSTMHGRAIPINGYKYSYAFNKDTGMYTFYDGDGNLVGEYSSDNYIVTFDNEIGNTGTMITVHEKNSANSFVYKSMTIANYNTTINDKKSDGFSTLFENELLKKETIDVDDGYYKDDGKNVYLFNKNGDILYKFGDEYSLKHVNVIKKSTVISDGSSRTYITNNAEPNTYILQNKKTDKNTNIIKNLKKYDDQVYDDVVKKKYNESYYADDDNVVFDNRETWETKSFKLGHFDEDGSKSMVNHDYSVYAIVTNFDGSKSIYYDTEDLMNATKTKNLTDISIVKEQHKNDIGSERLYSTEKAVKDNIMKDAWCKFYKEKNTQPRVIKSIQSDF